MTTSKPKFSTIKDVARAAGVDISTVSRVINNKPVVAPETREKVELAIRNLDYRPNSAARAMVTHKTRTFAFLIPTLADPNVAVLAAGMETRARQHGYSMLISGYAVNQGQTETEGFFREHRVDGLLLMSPRHFPSQPPHLPVATLEEAPVDNQEGGRLAGRHLRQLGHEVVAFLGGVEASSNLQHRLEGYRDIFADVAVHFGDWSSECGYHLALTLLSERPDVTAIFAASDAVALGVFHALHSSGRTVPDEMSVIGFDDIAMARYFWPRLTTIAQPLPDVGASAFDLLLARIEQRPVPPTAPLPVTLVQRDSTGPRKGG